MMQIYAGDGRLMIFQFVRGDVAVVYPTGIRSVPTIIFKGFAGNGSILLRDVRASTLKRACPWRRSVGRKLHRTFCFRRSDSVDPMYSWHLHGGSYFWSNQSFALFC